MKKFFDSIYFKIFSILAFAFVIAIIGVSLPPSGFPKNAEIHVAKNETVSEIAGDLAKKRIIVSENLFKAIVVFFHGRKGVYAGDYLFTEPQNTWKVALRMIKGDQGLPKIKVTIPEGATASDIGLILLKNIPNFSASVFNHLARPYEGYLFPDTYFFYKNTTPEEALSKMKDTFDKEIISLGKDFLGSNRSKEDVIIMASILEREASSTADRKMIAGILWKRLDNNMLLQVDTPLIYVTENDGYVSIKDTQIDSPYNTYKNKGLPKGPISNPGEDAILAALHPTESEYWYYLSDKNGVTHYSVNYDGHIDKKDKYLK